jgi:hydroxymethylpyrimidine/phosphomethylpyrimidine kinase
MHGRVLVIAGSDSGGGAGIQADIKTITAFGAYAATAVTALTAQNTLGVHAVHLVPSELVGRQISVVLDDIGADVVKTGMLGDAGCGMRKACLWWLIR